jgi:hypothetical protein
MSLLIGVPLVVLPTLLTRRVFARRLTGPPSSAGPTRSEPVRSLDARIQVIVEELKKSLGIADPVVASLVAENRLVVSVQRMPDRDGGFSMQIEEGFAGELTEDELRAMLAHELGHVWIFTHHPYLQTEELANQIALRVVTRETLDVVYERVWKRTGTRGSLVYLPVE